MGSYEAECGSRAGHDHGGDTVAADGGGADPVEIDDHGFGDAEGAPPEAQGAQPGIDGFLNRRAIIGFPVAGDSEIGNGGGRQGEEGSSCHR